MKTYTLEEFEKVDLSKLGYNTWYDCKTSQGLKSWTPDQMLRHGGVTHIYIPSPSTPLKQLSEITDEDFIELCKIYWVGQEGFDYNDPAKKEIVVARIKYIKKQCLSDLESLDLKMAQYLSQFYILPQYYPVSVSTLKEENEWDIAASGNSLREILPQSDHINPIELLEWMKTNAFVNGGKIYLRAGNSILEKTHEQLIETFNNRK